MGGLPRLAWIYILALASAALAAAIVSFQYLSWRVDDVASIALLTGAACIAQLFHITVPRVRARLSTATAMAVAVVVIFGPAAGFWSSLMSTAVSNLIQRRPLTRTLFNSSQLSLTYLAAGLAYRAIWNGQPLASLWPTIPAVIALAVTYFLLNSGLVVLIIALAERAPFVHVWRLSVRRVLVYDAAMVSVGLTLSILWTYNRWTIPLVVPLILVLHSSMSALGRMERETKQALSALARVIDRRDGQTYAHSERVAEYVSVICHELRLGDEETDTIVYAARLHDLGKVGIPDGLLLKPGPLTAEEIARFREHPEIGAAVIAQFPIFAEGVDIVRFEHEWYNGEGYPRGLCAEGIPLGSRIIAVADAYEAMTTDRPYREAMPPPEALKVLREGRGRQFDPAAVDAFLAALSRRDHLVSSMPGFDRNWSAADLQSAASPADASRTLSEVPPCHS